jgi:transcriptional regulator with XRE-family HTH domain
VHLTDGETPDSPPHDDEDALRAGGHRPGSRPLFHPVDHWEFSSDLGQRVRSLRQSRGLTLETVAQRSGISIGALSQLERGKGNPAFFTLIKIAHALEVPLTNLLQADTRTSPVVRVGERRPLAPHFFEVDGVESELLTPDLDRQLQVAQYKLPAGASTQPTPFTHHGEEFITVLAGSVTVGLDRTEHELHAGDSISYPAMTPHWFANCGTTVAELLLCCTPPTF